MQVLGKLVDILREGKHTPEKGCLHSYIATMIVNEVRMAHRRDAAYAENKKVSMDSTVETGESDDSEAIADTMVSPQESDGKLDEDWRGAVFNAESWLLEDNLPEKIGSKKIKIFCHRRAFCAYTRTVKLVARNLVASPRRLGFLFLGEISIWSSVENDFWRKCRE